MFERELASLAAIDPGGSQEAWEEARQPALDAIRSEAARDPGETMAWIRRLDPADRNDVDRMVEIYEAIAPDCAMHHDLFVTDLERLLEACAREPRNPSPCIAIGCFSFVGPHADARLRGRLRDILLARLSSDSPHVRRVCADMIGVFLTSGDAAAIEALVGVLDDADPRVRIIAYHTLQDTDALPPGASLSLLDRARVRFTDWSRYV